MMDLPNKSLLLLALLGACTSATPQPPSEPVDAPPPDNAALIAAAADDEQCTRPSDASTLGPDDAAIRTEALRALDEGHASHAKQKLEQVLKRHPGNYAAGALLEGVTATIDKHKSKAVQAFESIKRVRPPRAPEKYSLEKAIDVPKGPVPSLGNMRQKRNGVTDTENWFDQNGLQMPTITYDKLPAHVPAVLAGSNFEQAIDHGDHTVVIFGPNVAVLRPDGAVLRVFDLTIFNMQRHRPRVMWAQAVDGVLYVMTANMYYASESNGKNGYVSAIDLDDGALRWRSQPLVGNSYNFIIAGGYLISGYGFTAESDQLYVLERSTGKVAKKVPLGTKPEMILRRGGTLYVRGYDVDYSFDLRVAEEPAHRPVDAGLEATVARLFGESHEPSDVDRCRVDAAMVHLDHGRYGDAAAALWKVDRDYKNAPAIDALRRFINTAQAGSTIDLQSNPVMAQSAAATSRGQHPALPSEPAPRLSQKDVKHNAISDIDAWFRAHGANHAGRSVPNPWTSDAGDLPESVPLKYGPHDITAMMDHGDHMALIYAGRFVAIARGGKAAAILDLTELLGPNGVPANTYAAITQPDPAWAQSADGVVYVGAGMGIYTPLADKGHITAIDPKSGALLWRSAAQVSAIGFLIRGGYIISGYGTHGQPSAIFVLDRRTGRTVGKSALQSPPSYLALKGSELYARTYDRDYVFTLR